MTDPKYMREGTGRPQRAKAIEEMGRLQATLVESLSFDLYSVNPDPPHELNASRVFCEVVDVRLALDNLMEEIVADIARKAVLDALAEKDPNECRLTSE